MQCHLHKYIPVDNIINSLVKLVSLFFLRERKVHLHFKNAVKKCFNLVYLLSKGNSTCIQYKPKRVKTLKF